MAHAILVGVEDVREYMLARATADVATTLGWLASEDFTVVQQGGGALEAFGNAQVEFQRNQVRVRITLDRSQWVLDIAPPGSEFMHLDYLLATKGKDDATRRDPAVAVETSTAQSPPWSQALPELIEWIDVDDRTELIKDTTQAWKDAARSHWATLGPRDTP
jgi:hypothetical protein